MRKQIKEDNNKFIGLVAEKLSKDYWNYEKGLKEGRKQALEEELKFLRNLNAQDTGWFKVNKRMRKIEMELRK